MSVILPIIRTKIITHPTIVGSVIINTMNLYYYTTIMNLYYGFTKSIDVVLFEWFFGIIYTKKCFSFWEEEVLSGYYLFNNEV